MKKHEIKRLKRRLHCNYFAGLQEMVNGAVTTEKPNNEENNNQIIAGSAFVSIVLISFKIVS